jgi:hypothetical protein
MFCKAKLFFGQPLEVKQQIPNDSGPKPMRGYTPWRVEEVGKLSFDNMVRSLRDSKVGRALIIQILEFEADLRTYRSILTKGRKMASTIQTSGPARRSLRAFNRL